MWSACFLNDSAVLAPMLQSISANPLSERKEILDARDGDGFAPLHYAAFTGDAGAGAPRGCFHVS